MTTVEVVKEFWSLMQTKGFKSVGQALSDDFVLEWPQSGERIRGRENYAAMNERVTRTHGRWRFIINRIVGDEVQAVSDVTVTDGTQVARAISFFSITDGKIQKMVEFWPDPFPAEENRKHLVEVMDA